MDDSLDRLPKSEQFFREATLRICGSLDIHRALRSAREYIGHHLPADGMLLFVYDRREGVLRPVGAAPEPDDEPGETADIPLPPGARRLLERGDPQRVQVIERMGDHSIGRPVMAALGLPESSAVVVVLQLEGAELGALIVHGAGVHRFSEAQAGLLAQLNEPCAIALMNYLRFHELRKAKELLADDNRFLHRQLRQPAGQEIIGADFGLKGVMELVQEVAPLPSPVLLLGETGTGKEVIAGAVHNLSLRRDGPFIKINCGAIPPTLVDSELFGHEKGAFTGAVARKRGLFERATGGTVFLDEIGELPPEAQVRLLRVLQEKELRRVGGGASIPVDVRVIAATHRDLARMIDNGSFRRDLYYRLEVFPIVIPALRERTGDIPVLAQHFIRKKARELGLVEVPPIPRGVLDRLVAYGWPGNVRELENAVERGLILSRGGRALRFDGIGGATVGSESAPVATSSDGEDLTLNTVNANHIRRVLAQTRGRIEGARGAARLLGIHPSTLRNRMKKLGIPFGRAARGSHGER